MTKAIKKLLLVVFVLAPALAASQNIVTEKARTGKFALTNAKIYTVTNGIIENGTIVINNGIIEAVGEKVRIPADAEVIDYSGREIYPGMIDSGTKLGLQEIGSIAEAKDFQEYGDISPHMQALSAVNPNSVAIPVTRISGVTTALTVPSGGVLPGTAAAIDLFGYTPDQMFAGAKGIVMNFPSAQTRWNQTEEEAKKRRDEALKKANDAWDKAELYAKVRNSDDVRYYPEVEALAEVVTGRMKLFVEVNAAKDILSAIEWVQERGYKNVVFTGVAEGWRVADNIAAAGIPVITGPVIGLPGNQYDPYDAAYANPGILQKAGVKVALRSNNTENSRNLPYHAAFAAAYGMGREEALKAVTINPAEILGTSDRLGSIEEGKRANLFVATGDPFETSTQIVNVFIDGYLIPMQSIQTNLYDEFLNRVPGAQKHPGRTDG